MKYTLPFICLTFLISSCGSDPKVIPVADENTESGKKSGIFSDGNEATSNPTGGEASNGMGVHTVVVKEVLPTTKYVYLRVEEGGNEFWISTSKVEVKVGETYFYRDGLLKTNFHSTEYNRTFDKVYLVSQIVQTNHGNSGTAATSETSHGAGNETSVASAPKDVVVKGSIRIADLVANPKKYEGKEIQISGNVAKVNVNIMNRNWLHLKDGSKDDYDLVVTTDQGIPEGHTITMKGKVALNKDFGAGYKYQIIIEEGKIVN
ncbi:MAG: SH3-like domain-containing protein [Flavobacteriales bacterium]|nr:SH3-like domain-containing protein [Flavobacteriales bacterium]